MRMLFALVALILLAVPTSPPADQAIAQSPAGFDAYLKAVGQKAIRQGVSRATVDRVLPSLTYNPRVVELDRSQPGGAPNSAIPPFAPYKARHVDDARINGGRRTFGRLAPRLGQIERETGVPAPIITAIYGHETNYGSYTGDFDIPRSLATLAYEGRRRALFEGEFIAVLKMIDSGVPQSAMKGSWAGAMGKPQFLPSVYLRLAEDATGDGFADIWNSEDDAMASIANYFVQSGWRAGEPWGVPVSVPASLDRAAIANRTKAVRCPRVHERHSEWKTFDEWRRLGVVQTGGRPTDGSTLATLLEPDGAGNTAYLLTGNYRVILDYNCSNFYGLSVGLLADEIRP